MFLLSVLFFPICRAYAAVLYTNAGCNVTLPCFYAEDSAKYLCWYKQVAGEQPQIVSSFYRHSPDTNNFHSQFKHDTRFAVHPGPGFYHLNLSNVQASDSATYYCGRITITTTEFNEGIFLVLKESSRWFSVQQPESESVKPGGSTALNCTVHTGTSDAEHSVYWFQKDPGHSHKGIMYIHTNSSSQCTKSPDSPAQSCVYSLSKRNVSLSDAGMYYCAVASCGEILFAKGTRLDVTEKHEDTFSVLMLCAATALVVSVVLNIILICVVCKTSRGRHLHSGGLNPESSVPEYTSDSQNEESDALQYVALGFKKRHSKSRRQRSREEDTTYSGVQSFD